MGVETKKREKKERLIKAGIELFSQRGFALTTIEDITHQAGVAKGTFYLYFEDKKQFFGETINSMAVHQEENYKKIMDMSGPRERLQAYIASELDFYREHADFARFTITAVGHEAESFVNWYVDIQRKHIKYLTEIISQGCEAGAFDVEDPYRTAQFLQGAVFMFVAQEIVSPGEVSAVAKSAEFIVESFLKGWDLKA